MADQLAIMSFNANGLGDEAKRKAVFSKLRRYNSIVFLQETHSVSDKEKEWNDEWGGKILFSHGSSNSKGAAILFPPHLDLNIEEDFRDCNGRIIGCKICIDNDELVLINIYAPTRDHQREQLAFLDELKQFITQYESEIIIAAGDYNLYMNKNLDKLDTMSNSGDNTDYRNELQSILETIGMVDIWRLLNPDTRRYTWHSRGKASRLDYIFLSECLINNVSSCDIIPGIHSDHSILHIKIGHNKDFTRGRGLWKFNSTLLKDVTYVQNIKKLIVECKSKYKNLDASLKWEMTKHDIRAFTKPYSAKKRNGINNIKKYLDNKIKELAIEIDREPNNDDIMSEYLNVKKEIEDIEKDEANSSIFRSKIRWAEEGEKNSNFFLNLEKRNYVNKLITQLQVNDTLITDQKDILTEERNFYKTLYSEKLDPNSESYKKSFRNFDLNDLCKLDEKTKAECDKSVTEKELLGSLKELKNGRTPGSDGFPADFYKFFWIDVKDLVTDSINHALSNGQLSIEQRRGIITLIPKKMKNRLFLKNWRPISLLNTDYKIIAKLLACRLRKVLPHLIDDDQTGYINGRYIGQNIRIINDIIYFCENENKPGIILTIDYEKAFDSLNWNFMLKALKCFNFGTNFINYVSVLYNNIEAAVTNNGHISEFFKPERGIRQGCPLSAYLFLFAIELLAHHIRKDGDIKGITVFDSEIKLSQLADDTTCFLSDHKSLEQLLHTFNEFSLCAGLKINFDKTNAKYIGSLRDSDYYPHGLSWIKGSIESLGIVYTQTDVDNYMFNFKPRIKTLENTLNVWRQRHLSLKGKVTIINSLALSPLVYVSSVVDTPEKAIKEIDSLITNFMWNNGSSKIAKQTLIQSIDKGGLKLCHYESKVDALKLSWVNRIITGNKSRWVAVLKHYLQCDDLELFFSSKHNPRYKVSVLPNFYRSIIKLWLGVYSTEPTCTEQILNEVIWNNMYITSNKSPLYWGAWIKKGILKIRNLLDEKGKFLSHDELSSKFNTSCSFLNILQIRHSIPKAWLNKICDNTKVYPHQQGPGLVINNVYKNISKLKCKDFYWLLVDRINTKPSCIRKWTEVFPRFSEVDSIIWKRIFTMAFTICTETKIQALQYRLIHRIIPCNKWLCDITVKSSNICEYCSNVDDLLHFFLYCQNVHEFWVLLFKWWNQTSETSIKDELEIEECILFGFPSEIDIINVLNFIALHAKYYIYIQRLYNNNKIDFFEFLIVLKYKLRQKKYFLCQNNRESAFEPFLPIFMAL